MGENEPSDDVAGVTANPAGAAQAGISETLRVRIRHNFAIQHLNAADHFVRELRHHEAEHSGEGFGPHFELCLWTASAAIVLSFSAVEAAIFEAEEDLALRNQHVARNEGFQNGLKGWVRV